MLALQALAWLAEDEDRLTGFLGASGIAPGSLRDMAGDGDVLGAVLDHLLLDDQWVIAFCDQHGLPYSAPLAARAALPGGDATHWT